jgi:putative PIN family toxin of toxin-antitoxin system
VSTALFRNSLPFLAFRKAITEDLALLSPLMRVEVIDVFTRPKFDRYLSRAKRLAFVGQYFQLSIPVYPSVAVTDCRDPKDNLILECALAGDADLIVSGDAHLLDLNPWRGIAILTPGDYLALKPGEGLR